MYFRGNFDITEQWSSRLARLLIGRSIWARALDHATARAGVPLHFIKGSICRMKEHSHRSPIDPEEHFAAPMLTTESGGNSSSLASRSEIRCVQFDTLLRAGLREQRARKFVATIPGSRVNFSAMGPHETFARRHVASAPVPY